jgi:hypothetical protein
VEGVELPFLVEEVDYQKLDQVVAVFRERLCQAVEEVFQVLHYYQQILGSMIGSFQEDQEEGATCCLRVDLVEVQDYFLIYAVEEGRPTEDLLSFWLPEVELHKLLALEAHQACCEELHLGYQKVEERYIQNVMKEGLLGCQREEVEVL